MRIESRRTIKKTGVSTEESRYYLASQEATERPPEGWIDLSRQHWAGVENRNHWRRDATLGEDGTRLGNGRALMNLALLRSVNLRLLAASGAEDWLPPRAKRTSGSPSSRDARPRESQIMSPKQNALVIALRNQRLPTSCARG